MNKDLDTLLVAAANAATGKSLTTAELLQVAILLQLVAIGDQLAAIIESGQSPMAIDPGS